MTAQVTYQFHIESKNGRDISTDELENLANDALWGNYNESLEVEFEIECDGKSKNQDAYAINIDD